jgi:hypothetical protein
VNQLTHSQHDDFKNKMTSTVKVNSMQPCEIRGCRISESERRMDSRWMTEFVDCAGAVNSGEKSDFSGNSFQWNKG